MHNIFNYSLLAKLLEYPDNTLLKNTEMLLLNLTEEYKDKVVILHDFVEYLQASTLEKQQEYYSKTFDIQAIYYLDVGYVVFGEDYKRGVFLAQMGMEQAKAGIDCGSELADHITNVLKLLNKHPEPEFVEELAYGMLIPAIEEMLKLFADAQNHYRTILEIILQLLNHDFENSTVEQITIKKQKEDCTLSNYCGYNPMDKHKSDKVGFF